ncbi:uncharacterized protein TrAtP1_009732 [Trichoderma atroviride]|uniref:uncharacterized protein n=1 Tax=Hypocrea atroviridis TaxID=63577 RepID=UPI0033192A5F|nr:hypothetical protein TrAtP1_009732 [Trichoderma atroviride]
MAKRKSITSPSSPRKKARLDLPTDTPSLEISSDEGASASSPPTPLTTRKTQENR